MDYNYHTHTKRCRHAKGTPEEYVLRAIEGGIKHMGFSEHAPYIFPDGYESGYRVKASESKDYIDDILLLKEKYKEEIDISVGFEMEYYPSHFEKMLKIAKEAGAEYLILGQHFIGQEHPGGTHTVDSMDDVNSLKEYVENVVDAIKTGVFTYVAHPDIFNFTGSLEDYRNEMRKICVASKEYNVPLEINFLGIRDRRNYPFEEFWVIAGEEKAPVTFGFDAHDVQSAYDGVSIVEAERLVNTHKLNYIGKPKIIKI